MRKWQIVNSQELITQKTLIAWESDQTKQTQTIMFYSELHGLLAWWQQRTPCFTQSHHITRVSFIPTHCLLRWHITGCKTKHQSVVCGHLNIPMWALVYTNVGTCIYRCGHLYIPMWALVYTNVGTCIYQCGQLYIPNSFDKKHGLFQF